MSTPPNNPLPVNWQPKPPEKAPAPPISDSQWKLVGFILFFFLCSISLRIIYTHKLETTSVMFIGLPAGLAIFMSLLPRTKSALGSAMKGTTIGLLISAVLFGEGVVCVLMAAPIAYLIAGLVGALSDSARKTQHPGAQCFIWIVAAVMSFEGTSNKLSLSRDEEVRVEQTVGATPSEIESALAATPAFHTRLPLYFRLGFPRRGVPRGSPYELFRHVPARGRHQPYRALAPMERVRGRVVARGSRPYPRELDLALSPWSRSRLVLSAVGTLRS